MISHTPTQYPIGSQVNQLANQLLAKAGFGWDGRPHGQLGGDAQTAFLRAPVCDKHAGWRICPHQGQDPASLEVSDVGPEL